VLIAGEPDVGNHHRQFHKFTAIDDCTRLRVLRIYDRCNQQTAIQFADYVLERLAFRVEVIQTDNGPEFGASFYWHVLDKGAGHVYIKPRTPRRNGKVERSHRIDAEEFYRMLDGVVIDDAQVFNDVAFGSWTRLGCLGMAAGQPVTVNMADARLPLWRPLAWKVSLRPG